MPHDVLDNDDSVVDHEADGDRQSHQREVVEAVAQFVEHRERTDQRERHGDGRNDGRPEIAQEQENYHDHQRHGQQQCELHVVDRGADGLGAVGNDSDFDRGRDRGLQHRQHRFDPLDRIDDIGTGLALDCEDDRALVVVPTGDQIVFRPVDGLADVAYPHRRTVAVGKDKGVVVAGLEQLIVGVERVGLPRTVERAFRQVDIGLADDVADILEADTARGQRLGIDLNANCRLLLAADPDKPDAGYLRDLLQQNGLRICIDRGQRQGIRGHPENQDRGIRRVHPSDRGRIGKVQRQLCGRGVDRRQGVGCRPIDRAAEIELQGDLGKAERTRRRHLNKARDLTKLQFKRRRHRRRHRLGIGSRQLHGDLEGRIVDIGKGGDGQQRISSKSGEQESGHQ